MVFRRVDPEKPQTTGMYNAAFRCRPAVSSYSNFTQDARNVASRLPHESEPLKGENHEDSSASTGCGRGCLRLLAQQVPQNGQERFFLPKDTFWGYAQFEIAPPHNEIDPNLCAANAGNYGGKSAPCNAFAAIHAFWHSRSSAIWPRALRRFMLWGEPRFLFGKMFPRTCTLGRSTRLGSSTPGAPPSTWVGVSRCE
jgi:hypothetical protein